MVVTGRPDEEWGERVVAVVVAADPAAVPTLEDVRARVSERVSPYAAPRELEIVEEIPRTTMDKPAGR